MEAKVNLEQTTDRLKTMFLERSELARKQKDLSQTIEGINVRIMEEMTKGGWKSVEDPTLGQLTMVEVGTREQLDKGKLKEALLMNGVQAEVIGKCYKEATKFSVVKPHLTYTPVKQ